MRFLAHGTLDPSVAAALTRHGHKVVGMIEAQLPDLADASKVLEAADRQQLDVVTNDGDFVGEITAGARKFGRCIVYLQLPGGEVEQDDAIDRLFARYRRLSPGRLYTVTENRVKVRQLPQRGANENSSTASR